MNTLGSFVNANGSVNGPIKILNNTLHLKLAALQFAGEY